MAAEHVSCCIFDKVTRSVVDKIVKECGYIVYYKANVTKLESKFAELKSMEGNVQLDVAAAKTQSRTISRDTEWWLVEFAKVNKEGVDIFIKAAKVKGGCFKGRLNLKQRYLLSKNAVKLSEDVKKLRNVPVGTMLARDALPSGMHSMASSEDSLLLPSQKETMEEILRHLKNEENCVVAIIGLPGSGKRWLVEKVLNRVLEEGLFHEPPMVIISEKSLADIQRESAEDLDLPHTVSSEKRATNNSSKILLILDNVWEPLELKSIGLCAESGRKGMKVVFMSQEGHVHSPIQAQKYVKVDPLPPNDQWILFKRMAGDCVERDNLRPVAEKVLKECGGLPIAITTLGKALANGDEHDWRDALHQLQNSAATTLPNVNEKVYKSIQLSLKLIEAHRSQAHRLLMLCCQLLKDDNIPVEKVIRCAKGLQLSKDIMTLEGTRKCVKSLVKELKNRFLLQLGDKENTVKMHSVVRNVCLLLASENQHSHGPKYLVKHQPELKEWPHIKGKPHNAISITLTSDDNQKQLQLHDGFDYPNLELLQLQFHCDSVNIPSQFFHGMKQVKVLDCKEISLRVGFLRTENALSPISELLNLQALSLESCDIGNGNLSWIGSLKKVEVLSFYSSKLGELPSEIRELGNLKCLDLRCADGPKKIPRGVLSSLTKLEDLYLGNYDAWPVDSEQSDLGEPHVTELSSLYLLKTLQVRVKHPEQFQPLIKDFRFENLKRYQIAAVRRVFRFPEYEIGRSLRFSKADWHMLSGPKISKLLRSCENLTLGGTIFKDIFKACANLKTLDLSSCEGVEFIIEEKDSATALNSMKDVSVKDMNDLKEICKGNLPAGSLAALEIMKLDMLPKMTHLWGTAVQHPCLGNLRAIEISFCGAISSLFPISVAISLMQLQKLHVKRCDMLNGIVSHEGVAAEKVAFPKLKFLSLDNLPSFKSFFPDSEVANHDAAIQSLFTQQVELPSMNKLFICGINDVRHIVDVETRCDYLSKLRVVHVDRCENMSSIATPHSIRFLRCLERLSVLNCKSLEAAFDFEGFSVEEQSTDSVVLSKLDSVTLNNLENFKHIWRMVPEGTQGFKRLRSLEVSRCCSLKYVFPVSVAKMLDNLQQLKVKGCEKVEQIIEIKVNSSELVEIIEVEGKRCSKLTDKIRFSKLVDLQLENLESLASFSSGNHDLVFLILQNVLIKGCPGLKTFCLGQVITPELYSVRDGDAEDKLVWKHNLNTTTRYLHNTRFGFDFLQIKKATKDFEKVISEGEFGTTYEGVLEDGRRVAVKRLHKDNNLEKEFETEIDVLSKYPNKYLVSLIGYCDREMIIVYEYMPKTLADYLSPEGKGPTLTWKNLITILTDAAFGLKHLHDDYPVRERLIHGNIKPENIQIGVDGHAKISDFGYTRKGPTNQSHSAARTVVKGSMGYSDPHYQKTGRLTRRGDIYSFGVVLFQVLCRRPAYDESLEEDQKMLGEWAKNFMEEGRIDDIIDAGLKEQVEDRCLRDLANLAYTCLSLPDRRPKASELVIRLKSILINSQGL